ncbi:hypothetical protein GN956_G9968 [Arapaima gigas]
MGIGARVRWVLRARETHRWVKALQVWFRRASGKQESLQMQLRRHLGIEQKAGESWTHGGGIRVAVRHLMSHMQTNTKPWAPFLPF